ncbi:MAG TPA: hypothetical protein PLA77_04615 [Bacteroidales bacterium]|nr:hypothetical protein [Bacteroidales bacterium]
MSNSYDALLTGIAQNGYEFRFGKYFSSGLDLFKRNLSGFLGYSSIIVAISLLMNVIPYAGSLIYSLFSTVFMAGMYFVANEILRDENPGFERFFRGFQFVGELILAQIVSFFMILLGLILLIIPGIYLSVAYSFTSFFIIFMRYPYWEAMEWSRKIVSKNFWPILLFMIVLGLINLAGALFFGVGMVFTLPFTACVTYCAFEDIIAGSNRTTS